MTVATTSGRKFTIEKICVLAYKSVGLMTAQQATSGPQWEAQRDYAVDVLQILLSSLAQYGVSARLGGFSTVTITAADVTAMTYQYDLSESVMDVVGDGRWTPSGSDADDETHVTQITRNTWQKLGGKASTSKPVRFYTHRESDIIQVWLWPIPDAAGSVRLDVQRKFFDVTLAATTTLDLEDYWLDYIITALGRRLAEASTLPSDIVNRKMADEANGLRIARSKAAQRPPGQARLAHRTGW